MIIFDIRLKNVCQMQYNINNKNKLNNQSHKYKQNLSKEKHQSKSMLVAKYQKMDDCALLQSYL